MVGCEKLFCEYSCECGKTWGKEMRGLAEATRCDNCRKMCMPTNSHMMKFCHFECHGCGNQWESRHDHPMTCQACHTKATCKFTRVGGEIYHIETSNPHKGPSSRFVHSSSEVRRRHEERLLELRVKARSNPQANSDPFNRFVTPGVTSSSNDAAETAPYINGGSRSPWEDGDAFLQSPSQVESPYNTFNTPQGEINSPLSTNHWESSTPLNGNDWERPLATGEWGANPPRSDPYGVVRTPLSYPEGAATPSPGDPLNPPEGVGDSSLQDALAEMQLQQAAELVADGKILEELDEYQQAVDKYSEAIAIAPRHVPEYYKYRSRAYMKLDKMDEAQEDLRKSLMDLSIEYRAAPDSALRSGTSGEGSVITPNNTHRSTTSRGTPVFGIQTPQPNQGNLAGGANSATTKINLVPRLLNALAENKFEPIYLDQLLQEYQHDRSLENLVQEMIPSILDTKSIINFDFGSGRCFITKVGNFCPNDAICPGDCEMWHLCKQFILGSCEGSCGGVRIHNFFHKKNARILDQNNLYGVDPMILRALFLSQHRPQSLRPRLCHYYLTGAECYNHERCTFIHICRNFLNGCTCPLSHNLFNNHNNGVLRYYNVNVDGQCSHEEVVDRLALWDPAIIKPVDSAEKTNKVDSTPREARQNVFHSPSDPIQNGYHPLSEASEVTIQAEIDDIHVEPSVILPARQSNPSATAGGRKTSPQAPATAGGRKASPQAPATAGGRKASPQAPGRPTNLPTSQPEANTPARPTISPTAQASAPAARASVPASTPSRPAALPSPASTPTLPAALPSAIRPAGASSRPVVPKHVTFWSATAPPVLSPEQSPTGAGVPLLATAPVDHCRTNGHAPAPVPGWSPATPLTNGFVPQSAVPVRRSTPPPLAAAAPVLPAPVPGWRSKAPPAGNVYPPVSAPAAPFHAAAGPAAVPAWQPHTPVTVKPAVSKRASRATRATANTSVPLETWDTSWRDTWEPPIIVPLPAVPLLSKGSSTEPPAETYASRAAAATAAPPVRQSPSPTSAAFPALQSPANTAASTARRPSPPSSTAPPSTRQSVAPTPPSNTAPQPCADLWQYCLGNRVWMKLPRAKQVALEDAFCNVDEDEIEIQFTKDLTCSVVLEDVSKTGSTTTKGGVQVKRLGQDDSWLWFTGTGCNSVWQQMRGQCGVNVQHQLEEAFCKFVASGAEPQVRVMMWPHGQVRVDFRNWIVTEPGKGVFLDLRRRPARK